MRVMAFVGLFLYPVIFPHAQETLPTPWKHQDIGAAEVSGTAEYTAGTFAIQGSMDIWGVADGCHIVWQPCHGDVEFVARVASMDNPGGVAHAKAGICIRQSVDPGARHVTLCATATDGTQFLCRDKPDSKTVRIQVDAEAAKTSVPRGRFPCWLKIVRSGQDFRGYESADGQTWQLSGHIVLDLSADTVVGLTASSHKKDILTKARFDDVKLSQPKGGSR
jgi:hypothetical protein